MKKIITLLICSAIIIIIFTEFSRHFPSSQSVSMGYSILTPKDLDLKVYYTNLLDNEFSESKQVTVHVKGDIDNFQKITFTLPTKEITSLMITFGNNPGEIKIKDPFISSGLSVIPREKISFDTSSFAPNHIEYSLEDNILTMNSTYPDPYISNINLAYSNNFVLPIGMLLCIVPFILFLAKEFSNNHLLDINEDRQYVRHIIIVACFLMLITYPLIVSNNFDESAENRSEIQKPTLMDQNGILTVNYTDKYDAWFNDHFGGRDWLINKKNEINYKLFNTSNSPDAVVGKDNWLFYTDDDSVEKYQNDTLFTNEELEQIKTTQMGYYNAFKDNGIEYIIIVGPNKETIYPEYYPDSILKVNTTSRLDQVIDYLEANTPITIVDVRDELIANKPNAELYYKTDTHWNVAGGFIAYQELAKSLAEIFPQIEPMELSDFDVQKTINGSGDLLTIAGIDPSIYRGESVEYIFTPKTPYLYNTDKAQSDEDLTLITSIKDESLPTAMIYRDSFCGMIQIFLSNHFESAVYYSKPLVASDISEICESKPDVVIYEFVERYDENLLLP